MSETPVQVVSRETAGDPISGRRCVQADDSGRSWFDAVLGRPSGRTAANTRRPHGIEASDPRRQRTHGRDSPGARRSQALVALELHTNDLVGPIPRGLGLLAGPRWLSSHNSNLAGGFRDGLGNLAKVELPGFGRNRLARKVIPGTSTEEMVLERRLGYE